MGVQPLTAAIVSGAACLLAVVRSRGVGGYWIVDPRCAASVLVFLHVTGYPIYYLLHGEYPTAFGFEPLYAERANFMMLTAQLGFLLGTSAIPVSGRFGPSLHLDSQTQARFLDVLFWAALVTGSVLVYSLLSQWSELSQEGYGANQAGYSNLAKHYARFTNVSMIAIPTVLMLLISRATSSVRFMTRGTWILIAVCLIPSLLTGGRRDVFLVVGGIFLGWAFRLKHRPWRAALIFTVMLTVLSLVITRSRSGATLALEDRATAVSDLKDDEVSLMDQLALMYAGTASLTAAMTIYPDFVDHTLGRSYFEAAVNVLSPAFLTGRYPYAPMAHQFRELYYPNVRNYGFDYALSAEAYQNFGVVGPFMLFALLGYLLSTTYARASQSRDRVNPWLAIHVLTLLFVMYSLRTDSNALFKHVVYSFLWVVGLTVLARMLARRGVSRGGVPGTSTAGRARVPRTPVA